MDRRLTALALLAPTAFIVAGAVPGLGFLPWLLVPAASLAWAVRVGALGWALAMGAGALVVAGLMGPRLPEFTAAVASGWVIARALGRGRSPGEALVWATVPMVLLVSLSIPGGGGLLAEEVRSVLDELLRGAAVRGDIPAERLDELRVGAEVALDVLGRIWLAYLATVFWGFLALGYAGVSRWVGGGRIPRLPPLELWQVPDRVVWALLVGLVLVLLPMDAGKSLGWGLVYLAGFACVLRGLAVQVCFLRKRGLGRPGQLVVLAGLTVFFLPAHLAVTTGLGVFDTWFDFRGLRPPGERDNPLGFLRRPSKRDGQE
ncbi:MAG: DUF2232 domain-containing protein [Gemmatimonadota bacterium]|nr:DUF2232 domain-containing protein [Gemmatimonadota bacterium]MDP6802737.1 DUF2232 domain-containing protein [Gemmatimonadota bacterium]MDP7031742.1 DUF2232 domain-containing protein [Gemmatimonadota bacterium]